MTLEFGHGDTLEDGEKGDPAEDTRTIGTTLISARQRQKGLRLRSPVWRCEGPKLESLTTPCPARCRLVWSHAEQSCPAMKLPPGGLRTVAA